MEQYTLLKNSDEQTIIKKESSLVKLEEHDLPNPNLEKLNAANYLVVLVNQSNLTVIAVSTNYQNWVPTQLINNTCSYGCGDNRCYSEEKWGHLVYLECGQNYNLWLKFKDSQGNIFVMKKEDPYQFYASCNVPGGILTFC